MTVIFDEQKVYQDKSGKPLVNGYVYFGEANTDPTELANQIAIYADNDFTTRVANPQRTDSFGRPESKVWLNGTYSKVVQDEKQDEISNEPEAGISESDVSGPDESISGDIATFSDTTGEIIQDSGVDTNDFVSLSGSTIDGNIPLFSGTTGKIIEDSGVTPEESGDITLGTEVEIIAQDEIEFTGIPSGTQEIYIILYNFWSFNTEDFIIQLGNSGGFETADYINSNSISYRDNIDTNFTSAVNGFSVTWDVDTRGFTGYIFLTLSNPNTNHWISSHMGGTTTGGFTKGGGSKFLSSELTQLKIFPNGSFALRSDGTINIQFR